MTIKRVEFERKKKNVELRQDPVTGRYVGYQIDLRDGADRRRDTFATKKEAENFVEALKKKRPYRKAGLMYPIGKPVRLKQLLDRRIELIPHPKEKVRARRVFAAFQRVFEDDPLVINIRTAHFQKFINERALTVKPESVNREMTLLRTAFSRAGEMFPEELEGYEAPKIPRPRFKQQRRERVIMPDEFQAILANILAPVEGENEKQAANRMRVAHFWQIGWYLGLRYGEIEKLRKTDYKGGRLRVVRWKTGDVTYFEADDLPDQVHRLLKEASADNGDYLFSLNGSVPKNFYQISRKAAKAAGLTWGQNDPDAITFHSLRHSFATRLAEVTDLPTAKGLTGHSNETMLAVYLHSNKSKRAAAMKAMYGESKEKLAEIYEQVRSGKMTLEEFLKAVS